MSRSIHRGTRYALDPARATVPRPVIAGALSIAAALVALAFPVRASAQFTGQVSATAEFQSNSNVFDLTRGQAPPVYTGETRRSDTYYSYGAQLEGRYDWSRQEFFAKVNMSRYSYQRFTRLNHNSYGVDTGWNWKLGDALDGKLEVTRTRSMVPFYNLLGAPPELTIATDQRETAQVGLKLNSRWKIVSEAYASRADQPVAAAPNLRVYENGVKSELDYLGVAGITSGLMAGYLAGEYLGSQGSQYQLDPTYNQRTAGMVAKYERARSALNGQAGYTRRASGTTSNSTSGFTGLLEFTYQLTPRTRIKAKADRAINNYVLNQSAEIDTDLGANILWQATYKTGVSLGYTFSYRDFPRQGNDPVGSLRVDIQEAVTLNIDYQPRKWLLIRPYANVQTRRSTYVGGHYSSNVYGIDVTVRFPDRPPLRK